jgi:hypothetical protein
MKSKHTKATGGARMTAYRRALAWLCLAGLVGCGGGALAAGGSALKASAAVLDGARFVRRYVCAPELDPLLGNPREPAAAAPSAPPVAAPAPSPTVNAAPAPAPLPTVDAAPPVADGGL